LARHRPNGGSRRSPQARPDSNPFADPIAVAIVDVVAERGYAAASIEEAIERARVTRAEFDRRFTGKEDCALQVLEAFIADFKWRISTAYCSYSDWRTSLRAAAHATADWMEEAPNLIRFGVLEVLNMESEMARVRREEAFVFCAGLIDDGRVEAPDPDAVPASAPMVAAGSIIQLLTHRLQKGGEIDPRGTVPEMMYQVVRVYLGEEVAREELTLPRPGDSDAEG
jgi:AcrR family transcriptional regulator